MNWVDFAVIGVVIAYALIGYARGFIFSVFKVVSFFVAAFLAVQVYPYVSKILISVLQIDKTLRAIFSENLGKLITPEQLAKPNPVSEILQSWNLPKPIEEMVINGMAANAGTMKQGIVEGIVSSLSVACVNIISIVIVFAVVSFVLIFARNILEGIASLPIFRQVNRAGGFAFGLLEGVIIIYIIFAVLTLFSSAKEMQTVFMAINSSLFAKQMYANNLLLVWAFGKKL